MWGNDPTRILDDRPPVQTVINPAARDVIQHLGYKDPGRSLAPDGGRRPAGRALRGCADLAILQSQFGQVGPSHSGDLDFNRKVDITDLSRLLSLWNPPPGEGACPTSRVARPFVGGS